MKQLTDRELETIWAHYATMAPAGARRVACMRAAIAADREINGITGEAQPAEQAKGREEVAYRLVGNVDERPFNTLEHALSAQDFYRSGGIETQVEHLYTTPPTPPAGVPDGWQPIETAPKDSEDVLTEPEPQAQAGEPEVVAWRYYLEKGQGPLHHAQEENAKMFSFDGTAEPLITLQSHREVMTEKQRELEVSRELQDRATEAMVELEDKANRVSRYHHERTIQLAAANETIAKKDAALKVCMEALGTCRIMAKDNDGNYTIEVTPKIITSAITQAQGIFK